MNVLRAFGCRKNSGSGGLHKLQMLEEYHVEDELQLTI